MDKEIVEYIKQKYHLLIGVNTAEDIKKQYEKKLGVDFSRSKTTFETKEEFVKKYR